MIALLPVAEGVEAVKADRIVAVRREKTKLRLWVDFGGRVEMYVLEADENAIRHAWYEYVNHYDASFYVWDLTWLTDAPAPAGTGAG